MSSNLILTRTLRLWYSQGMATDPSDIHLSDEQKQRLAEASDATGLSAEQILDDALRIALKLKGAVAQLGEGNGRTLYDAMAEDGAIGCIKGGPTDVSTNQKYMEGFGTSGSGTNSN